MFFSSAQFEHRSFILLVEIGSNVQFADDFVTDFAHRFACFGCGYQQCRDVLDRRSSGRCFRLGLA